MRKFKIVVTERGRREMAEAEEEKNKKRDKKASTWKLREKYKNDENENMAEAEEEKNKKRDKKASAWKVEEKNNILMKMIRWLMLRGRRTRNENIKVKCKNQNLRGNKSLMFALILLIWIWKISMNTMQNKWEEKENSQLPI